MSKAESPTAEDVDETGAEQAESDADPDIESDLVREELRIDGICGVY
jgi:mycofactocin precursor